MNILLSSSSYISSYLSVGKNTLLCKAPYTLSVKLSDFTV